MSAGRPRLEILIRARECSTLPRARRETRGRFALPEKFPAMRKRTASCAVLSNPSWPQISVADATKALLDFGDNQKFARNLCGYSPEDNERNPAYPVQSQSISETAADYARLRRHDRDNLRAISARCAARDGYRGVRRFAIRATRAPARSQL